MYKGTDFKDFDKSLLNRNTLLCNENLNFPKIMLGNRFRKYGDHFTKLKDLEEYELNFIRDDFFLTFFLCKKHKEHTEDLASISFKYESYFEEGEEKYLNILKENLKELNYEKF